jgi:hypothetical protein
LLDPKMLDGLDGPRREALLGRFEAGSPTMTQRRQNTIAVVLDMTDEAIGRGHSQRHGTFPGVAVFRGGKE